MSDRTRGYIKARIGECVFEWSFLVVILFGLTTQVQGEPLPLYLEAYINGTSTKLIAAFQKHEDGRFSATHAELNELGLKTEGIKTVGDQVFLSDISGLSFTYDENDQAIYVETANENRIARNYAVGGGKRKLPKPSTDLGALVNYAINAQGSSNLGQRISQFDGVSALVEARAFGKLGSLSSAFVFGANDSGVEPVQRLDTNWSYSDQPRMVTYTVGDFISSGPIWSRPVRLGGIRINQYQFFSFWKIFIKVRD